MAPNKTPEQLLDEAQKRLKDAEDYKAKCESEDGAPLSGNLLNAKRGVNNAQGSLKGIQSRYDDTPPAN